jgi:hypothetical protein
MLEFGHERLVAPYAAVDGLVEGNEETGGLLVMPDLDALGILRVIEQRNRLAHEPDGRFVEPAVEGDGAILVYLAPHGDAEVIAEILGCGPDEMDLGEIALEGRLACGGMHAGVVVAVDPRRQERVESVEGKFVGEQRKELFPDAEEEALDLAAPRASFACEGCRAASG